MPKPIEIEHLLYRPAKIAAKILTPMLILLFAVPLSKLSLSHDLTIPYPLIMLCLLLTMAAYVTANILENQELNKHCQPREYPNYNQELADSLDWKPLIKTGYISKQHNLCTPQPSKIQLRHCKKTAFKVIVPALCVYLYFGGAFYKIIEELAVLLVPALFGAILIYKGFRSWKYASPTRNFDKMLGYYWQGDSNLTERTQIKQAKDATLISDIVGIQILPEQVRMNNSSYTSFELNLMIKDGTRVNLTDHADRLTIMNNARDLAEFLNVAVYLDPKYQDDEEEIEEE